MFQFRPVVPDLPTLAKTIGGRIEVVKVIKNRTASGMDRWIARIVAHRDCHVGFQLNRDAMSLFSPSATAHTAKLARLRLARALSHRTFVVRHLPTGQEHYLPLGVIRP